MANLEHIKGSRTQVLNGFPSNSFGNDGDIVTANIKGKGVYLCVKNNSRWFIADKLNDLRQLDRPTMQNLTLNNLSIKSSNLTTSNATGDFTLDVNGDIALSADGGNVTMDDGTTTIFDFDVDGVNLKIMDDANVNDYFNISVGAEGATTISTVDAGTAVAHLTLQPDGDLVLDAASQKVIINATDGLFLDGGGDTQIYESSADNVRFVVGGDTLLELTELGADGNQISFGSSCAGFVQQTATYNASTTIVDFRQSNKWRMAFGAGNITNLTLTFPQVSGNFQLLLKQDGTGSRTITNYKAIEFDESAADGEAAVKFAGGSNPTLTTDANHVDILSFYWDADNEIAYGVATLDFQF
tara:strand:- start:3898 stop:4965 length:1068 start_codon:yes stop_codon:yes gene_type:complete